VEKQLLEKVKLEEKKTINREHQLIAMMEDLRLSVVIGIDFLLFLLVVVFLLKFRTSFWLF